MGSTSVQTRSHTEEELLEELKEDTDELEEDELENTSDELLEELDETLKLEDELLEESRINSLLDELEDEKLDELLDETQGVISLSKTKGNDRSLVSQVIISLFINFPDKT